MIFILYWLTRVDDLIEMMLQLSQFPLPLAAIFIVCTKNIKLGEGALQALVWRNLKVVFLAHWAAVVGSFDSLTTRLAEACATACSLVWVAQK